jgi:hypothetical protein
MPAAGGRAAGEQANDGVAVFRGIPVGLPSGRAAFRDPASDQARARRGAGIRDTVTFGRPHRSGVFTLI